MAVTADDDGEAIGDVTGETTVGGGDLNASFCCFGDAFVTM